MNQTRRKFEVWSAISIALLLAFLLFFVYPICTLLKQAFTTSESAFTFDNFIKFFSKPYYYNTIFNSFKVSIAVMLVRSTAARCAVRPSRCSSTVSIFSVIPAACPYTPRCPHPVPSHLCAAPDTAAAAAR